MQLPQSIKGLFLFCVQKFLLNEFNKRRKLKYIKSITNTLNPETRQMPLSSRSNNASVSGVLVRLRSKQMHQKPARIHPTLFAWPWPQGYHVRLVFHSNKNPKYQVWQRSECYFRGEGEEKEEHTTKVAKKTKVKDLAKKWKGETIRRKGTETRGRESIDSREGHRKRNWGKRARCWQSSALSYNQEFPLKTISY